MNKNKERLQELERKISLAQYDIDHEIVEIKLLQKKKEKLSEDLEKVTRAIKKHNKRKSGLKANKTKLEKEYKQLSQSYGFDDELFENMETVDVLMTDKYHVPKENMFYDLVKHNGLTGDFDKEKELEKYDYKKIEEMRTKRKHTTNG